VCVDFNNCTEVMELHIKHLQEVCRLGGKKFTSNKQSTRYNVEKYGESLLAVHKIDVSKDSPDIHPQYICLRCQKALKRASEKGATHCGGGCGALVTWAPHTRTDCTFCTAYNAKGRPPVKEPNKLSGKAAQWSEENPMHARPTTPGPDPRTTGENTEQSTGMDIPREDVLQNACAVHRAGIQLERKRFVDQNVLPVCTLCTYVVDGAMETACCEEVFCGHCLCEWLSTHNTCPICNEKMSASSLSKPGKFARKVISNLSIHCDNYQPALNGCPEVVPLCSLKEHVEGCPFNSDSNSKQPAIRTVRPSSTVEEVTMASPSKVKGNVAGNLTTNLVAGRSEDGGNRLEVKTSPDGRGHPLVYHLAPSCIVPSTVSSTSTIKQRGVVLTRIAESVCGGSDGSRVQMVAGLKRLSAVEQEELLVDAGLRSTTPAAGTALAIKADLRLPWSQLRKLRKWLRIFGVKLESEHVMREFIAKTLPSYTAMELPMTKKNGDVVMAAAVFFPDLVSVIVHFLDMLSDNGKLTWHDGAIPPNEMWLKLGGDHGGGNFKLSVQVANVSSPNATSNTIPVMIFKEKDTAANLETALGQYRTQVEQLQGMIWQGKTIRLFMFGDYEFQTVNFGLSGSGGVRPCLHCHCKKKDMVNNSSQWPAADQQPRTLETLASDHGKFAAAGSQLSTAKHYNNVIRHAILPVPISQVIIPVLHLDLGIYTWIFDAFLKDLKMLDSLLASKSAELPSDSNTFTKLRDLHHQLHACQLQVEQSNIQVDTIQQQLQYVVLHLQEHVNEADAMGVLQNITALHGAAVTNRDQHTKQLADIRKSIDEVSGSKDFTGPCLESVEPVLQEHGIERQVYHGGAFIGNHVHQGLKPTVVTAIANCHIAVVQERAPELLQEAIVVARRYTDLFFSHCNSVKDSDIHNLEVAISSFLRTCRTEVVQRSLGHITPKLHLLESHTAPLMKQLHVGLGLLAEQGAESLHSSMNTLDVLFKNIPGDLARLKAVADQHLLTTTKEATTLPPQSRKRKAEEQLQR